MKKHTLCMLLCFFILDVHFSAGQSFQNLKGLWTCQTDYGVISLEFISEHQLIFDGEIARYRLQDRIIRVTDEWGVYDHPYAVHGANLIITFP